MKYFNVEKKEIWLKQKLKNKKVSFIYTKNNDYIRIVQEQRIITENAEQLCEITSYYKNALLRILNVIFKVFFATVSDADVVFIGFHSQLILPLFWRKFKDKEVICDFFVSFYDTLVFDRKKVSKDSVIANWLWRLDKKTLDKSDIVICDTKAHADYFAEEFEVNKDKFHVLYLEADKSVYFPRKVEKDERLKDKFVVLYFGSILPLQGIEVVLECIKQLQDDDKFFFQIIGPIKGEKPIYSNVEFINWLTQAELADAIAKADLCLAGHFHGTIEKAKRTIPGKAYIYEAMGKTMVLGDGSANHELFEEDERHCFVEMGSVDELKKIILNNK